MELMTVVDEVVVASPADARRSTVEERRSTIIGFVLIALAVVVLALFAFGVEAESEAEFGLSLPNDRFQDLSWVFNPRTLSIVVGVGLAALGGQRLMRRQLTKTNLVLGIGLLLFILAFLSWAAAGGSFSMVGMLRSTVTSAVVIVLGGLCGLMCERAGIVNIGIEGQLLTSAFVATVLSSAFGTLPGVLGAMAVAGLLGWALAWFSIRFRVDQVITGVVINIFSLGLTSFLASRVLAEAQDLNTPRGCRLCVFRCLRTSRWWGPCSSTTTSLCTGC